MGFVLGGGETGVEKLLFSPRETASGSIYVKIHYIKGEPYFGCGAHQEHSGFRFSEVRYCRVRLVWLGFG